MLTGCLIMNTVQARLFEQITHVVLSVQSCKQLHIYSLYVIYFNVNQVNQSWSLKQFVADSTCVCEGKELRLTSSAFLLASSCDLSTAHFFSSSSLSLARCTCHTIQQVVRQQTAELTVQQVVTQGLWEGLHAGSSPVQVCDVTLRCRSPMTG